MPDWLSHIIIGLLVAEVFNIDKKGLVVLGSLLPDFVVKINLLPAFFHVNDNLLFVTRLYHSPVMGLIIPAIIAPLFKYDWRRTYIYIMLGFMLHLFADSFTRHYYDGILLYPISNGFFSFNVLWPEQYWIILIVSLVAYALVKLIKS
ncbi:metal-dependent hydrolase [Candidatus Woesearchaeota archaeon]|nr:metal-dependent hydrolase [Candidatus Woesearchaeota archaeon]